MRRRYNKRRVPAVLPKLELIHKIQPRASVGMLAVVVPVLAIPEGKSRIDESFGANHGAHNPRAGGVSKTSNVDYFGCTRIHLPNGEAGAV